MTDSLREDIADLLSEAIEALEKARALTSQADALGCYSWPLHDLILDAEGLRFDVGDGEEVDE